MEETAVGDEEAAELGRKRKASQNKARASAGAHDKERGEVGPEIGGYAAEWWRTKETERASGEKWRQSENEEIERAPAQPTEDTGGRDKMASRTRTPGNTQRGRRTN